MPFQLPGLDVLRSRSFMGLFTSRSLKLKLLPNVSKIPMKIYWFWPQFLASGIPMFCQKVYLCLISKIPMYIPTPHVEDQKEISMQLSNKYLRVYIYINTKIDLTRLIRFHHKSSFFKKKKKTKIIRIISKSSSRNNIMKSGPSG